MIRLLPYADLVKVPPGTRVRFVETWDIFPYCFVPEGTGGVVITIANGGVYILPDDHRLREALAEWDGCIWLAQFGVADVLSPLVLDDRHPLWFWSDAA